MRAPRFWGVDPEQLITVASAADCLSLRTRSETAERIEKLSMSGTCYRNAGGALHWHHDKRFAPDLVDGSGKRNERAAHGSPIFGWGELFCGLFPRRRGGR